MKVTTLIAPLAAATLLFATTAMAQGQQGGQQGGQQQRQQAGQQQRQAERAMSQDQAMDHERMQTRERDRTQDREHAAAGSGEGIYGGNLMTVQERNRYREQLGGLKTEQARNEFKARHQDQMQLRAKERGIKPEVTTD